VDDARPEGSGVALAGSYPNCEANAPKSRPSELLRPPFGNWPIDIGLTGVGLFASGLEAPCEAGGLSGSSCGKAWATVARVKIAVKYFILYIQCSFEMEKTAKLYLFIEGCKLLSDAYGRYITLPMFAV
jgi:hypothetical protein